MQRHTTTTRRTEKPKAPTLGLIGFATAGVVGLGLLTGSLMPGDDEEAKEPWGTVRTDDAQDPAVFTPEDRPLVATLTTRFPNLTIEQQHYQRMTEVLPRLPIAYGITDPPIGFTDNQAAVFTALIYTESSFDPWENGAPLTSSAGCQGIAQLCGDLLTHQAIFDQARNLYIGAAYFKRLIDENDGDILAAVRTYKGITTPDMAHLGTRVWDFLILTGVQ